MRGFVSFSFHLLSIARFIQLSLLSHSLTLAFALFHSVDCSSFLFGSVFIILGSLLHHIYTSVVCRVAAAPYSFKRERKHEDDSLCGSVDTSRRILATGSQAPNILYSRIIGAAKNVKERIFLCYSTI